jgi:hypothetical protein
LLSKTNSISYRKIEVNLLFQICKFIDKTFVRKANLQVFPQEKIVKNKFESEIGTWWSTHSFLCKAIPLMFTILQ